MANEDRSIIKIGHRGASGYEPENTLLSFEKAIELGADMIELDVQRCASGQLVVIHDETVNRTTNGTGFVNSFSLDELKALDIGKGQSVSTLQEVLDFVDHRVVINIELKGPETEELVANTLLEYIGNRGWQNDDFLISSFNHQRLARIKRLIPEIKIGMLICHLPLDYAAMTQQIDVYSLHVSLDAINQDLVNDAHYRGVKLFVFTANTTKEIEYLKSLGVDGIFSDYPDLL
jgi:glycerophosphoryl diester phosphodiesterase